MLEPDVGLAVEIALRVAHLCAERGLGYVFKASFDKANRTSHASFRGPGLAAGLNALARVKEQAKVPVLTDVHDPTQVGPAAEVVDVLQVPAFLCRQTDLVTACAASGLPVNIKKGQFLSPWEAANIVNKLRSAGGDRVMLTERGTTFGYNNLVADMRSIPVLQSLGVPAVFDATHSLQLPGGAGAETAGQRQFAPHLTRAAVAAGCDAVFLEVHPDPAASPCDRETIYPLDRLPRMLDEVTAIRRALDALGPG